MAHRQSRAMRSEPENGAYVPARWFWQPDPVWLNSINTTNLRTLNAIRAFVAVSLLFTIVFTGVVAYAMTRCGILLSVMGHKVFQMLPPPGRLPVTEWMACEESITTARLLDFASSLFTAESLLVTAMAGIAAAAMIGKRATDTEHRVAVEQAKKAPLIVPPIAPTAEHQAQQPTQQVNVNVGEDAVISDASRRKTEGMGDSRTDDERGE